MLTISEPLTSEQVEEYFEEEYQAQGDYYLGKDETKAEGQWLGKGAERLGLNGSVDREAFNRLARGFHPHTRQPIVKLAKKGEKLIHRSAWDLTFNAPKSVSVMAIIGQDHRLVEAHLKASDRALVELERQAQVRAGANRERNDFTRNLVIARFNHDTNRALESHLHSHHVMFNVTWAEGMNQGRGGWRALQAKAIFRMSTFATDVYRAELAAELKKLGYEVVIGQEGAPEIKGVSQGLMDAFSTRRQQIKAEEAKVIAAAEAAGRILTAKERKQIRQMAAHNTRMPKQKDVDRADLHRQWLEKCAAHGLDVMALKGKSLALTTGHSPDLAPGLTAKEDAAIEVIHLAIDHFSERSSLFEEKEIETFCLQQHAYAGVITLDDIRAEMKRMTGTGLLIKGTSKGKTVYTTEALQIMEAECIATMHDTQDRFHQIGNDDSIRAALQLLDSDGNELKPEQQAGFAFVCRNRDQFCGLHGKAGVGKSYLYGRLKDHAEANGYEVIALAPSIPATENLRKDGLTAATVQSYVMGKRGEEEIRNGKPRLLLVDEAGMIGTSDMHLLLERAVREGSRVILSGDTRQFASVPAGRIFDQLIEHGLPIVDLENITRQAKAPEEVRLAVQEISDGNVKTGMEILHQHGRVIERAEERERYEEIARLYTSFTGRTLVVVATNEERKDANRFIRKALIDKGEVETEGFRTEVMINRNVTKASRKLAGSYQQGDAVRFAKTKHGQLKEGVWYRVADRDLAKNMVTVEDEKGNRITYNPKYNYGIEDVFSVEERTFAKGDQIQLRKGDQKLGIQSGKFGTVIAVDKRGRALIQSAKDKTNVKVVDLTAYKTIDYSYATTGHSAQGLTVDTAIALQTSEHREEVVNFSSAYVSTSRTRNGLYVVVDDFEKAVVQMTRDYRKEAALDIEPEDLPDGGPILTASELKARAWELRQMEIEINGKPVRSDELYEELYGANWRLDEKRFLDETKQAFEIKTGLIVSLQ